VTSSRITWKEYIIDCGSEAYLSNGVKSKKLFDLKYKSQIVNWEGVFLEMSKNKEETIFYIKMQPTDSASDASDLQLQTDRFGLEDLNSLEKSLRRGHII